jgi:hypothetical protein
MKGIRMREKRITPEINQMARATEEAIRTRAYEIYLERGDEAGSDLQDWLRAEAELQRGMAAQVA